MILKHVLGSWRGAFRSFIGVLEVERKIVDGVIRGQPEPAFGLEMLTGFRLALRVNFEPQATTTISGRLIRREMAGHFQVIFQLIQRLVEKRAEQIRRKRPLKRLIRIKRLRLSSPHRNGKRHDKENGQYTSCLHNHALSLRFRWGQVLRLRATWTPHDHRSPEHLPTRMGKHDYRAGCRWTMAPFAPTAQPCSDPTKFRPNNETGAIAVSGTQVNPASVVRYSAPRSPTIHPTCGPVNLICKKSTSFVQDFPQGSEWSLHSRPPSDV